MRPSTTSNLRIAAATALAGIALIASACGTASAGADLPKPDPTTTSTIAMDDGHEHDMSSMNMGDPTATPAASIDGAEVAEGSFGSLPGVTPDDISGTAWLARHGAGTTVTIELVGLAPATDHIAHVHERPCSEAGGAHFRFDEDGDHHPPNEIHLAFTTDDAGGGAMTAENDRVATADAVSVVVHAAGPDSPKLACADLLG